MLNLIKKSFIENHNQIYKKLGNFLSTDNFHETRSETNDDSQNKVKINEPDVKEYFKSNSISYSYGWNSYNLNLCPSSKSSLYVDNKKGIKKKKLFK